MPTKTYVLDTNVLKDTKMSDQALIKFPKFFNEIKLKKRLIQDRWLSSKDVEILLSKQPTWVEVLEDHLLDDSQIWIFKETKLFQPCLEKAVRQKNGRVIRKLIDNDLIDANSLKQQLNQAPELLEVLKEELRVACEQLSAEAVEVFLDVSVPYDERELNHIAKSGDYALLALFIAKGADVAPAVFLLIQNGQDAALKKLLEGSNGKKLDPNLRNREGRSLLIEAIICDKLSIVQTLISFGANPLICSETESAFELSKGKHPRIRELLYYPNIQRNLGFGTSWDNKPIADEKALEQFLDRKTAGKPSGKYYALFIKVNNVAVAILKSTAFLLAMLRNFGHSFGAYPRNRIHCWVSTILYPIPQEWIPNPTSLSTIALAIFEPRGSSPTEELVKIDGRQFAFMQLDNTFKADDPSKVCGFKYSFEEIQTHGHGENPQAALSSFKEHKGGVLQLKLWKASPTVSVEADTLVKSDQRLMQLFQAAQENTGNLEALAIKVDQFIQKAEQFINVRYGIDPYVKERWQEDQRIDELHQEIEKELANAHSYTYNENFFGEWQSAIQRQIQALQQLEAKLRGDNYMETTTFERERQSVENHLTGIKDILKERTVTSAEAPTIKIYTSPLLVQDIFSPTAQSINVLKRAICQTIACSLQNFPLEEDETPSANFQEYTFRERIITQLHHETQFCVTHANRPQNYIDMQWLASDLAHMRDLSAIINLIPPSYNVQFGYITDSVHNETLERFINSYVHGRKILDRFWLEICYNENILGSQIDIILELVIGRVLLMDEEIRKKDVKYFLYPLLEDRHPKPILDEQLFFLLTSLLIALSKLDQKMTTPGAIAKMIEFVQVKLTPALQGSDKERYKIQEFFILELIETLRNIQGIVEAAWDTEPSNNSPFKPLHDLLHGYSLPEKRKVENSMEEYFKKLRPGILIPNLDPSVENLVSKVKETKNIIQNLLHSSDPVDNDSSFLKPLQEVLENTSRVMGYTQWGKNSSSRTVAEIMEMIRNVNNTAGIEGAVQNQRMTDIRECIDKIKKLIKKFSDQIEINNAKDLQLECGKCIRSLTDLKMQQLPDAQVFSNFKERSRNLIEEIRKAGSSETLIQEVGKLEIVLAKLAQKNNEEDEAEIVLEIKELVENLKTFLNGKKGAKRVKLSNPIQGHVEQLSQLVDPWLNIVLYPLFGKLLEPLKACQKALHTIYLKKLKQMSAQLYLGIREQIYYTTSNNNMTYYLWNGKPFNALPYHTDNAVHIPLIDGYFPGLQPKYKEPKKKKNKFRMSIYD